LPEAYCPGYPYYAGTLSYKRTLPVDCATLEFEVNFGDWDTHDIVELLVNGHSLGVRAWSPYRWYGTNALLIQGANTVEVRVTGTLICLLEGKYFDYRTHALEPVHAKSN
jgi:hypothetical protein